MMAALPVIWALRGIYRVQTWLAWRGFFVPDDVLVRDITIDLKDRTLKAQVIQPKDSDKAKNHPLILYLHGGGMNMGSIYNTHHNCIRVFSSRLECTIVALEYRLAPETQFPAGADDCVESAQWLLSHMQDFDSNGKLVVGGDSAGGMTAIAFGCRVKGLAGTILFYPNTAYQQPEFESWEQHAYRMGSSKPLGVILLSGYFGKSPYKFEEEHKEDPDIISKAFPLRTTEKTLKDLMPPTFLVTCEYDILRDEGKAFVEKACKAGVKLVHHHYEEEHGFLVSEGTGKSFDDCIEKLKEWSEQL
jgi:acetyl esterase